MEEQDVRKGYIIELSHEKNSGGARLPSGIYALYCEQRKYSQYSRPTSCMVHVLTEGRSAAKKYDCKYIEVSAAIDHRVDDLLVGILKQIRLTKKKADKLARARGHQRIMHRPEEACCHILRAQQNKLSKLFRGKVTASKSCENLYEL